MALEAKCNARSWPLGYKLSRRSAKKIATTVLRHRGYAGNVGDTVITKDLVERLAAHDDHTATGCRVPKRGWPRGWPRRGLRRLEADADYERGLMTAPFFLQEALRTRGALTA